MNLGIAAGTKPKYEFNAFSQRKIRYNPKERNLILGKKINKGHTQTSAKFEKPEHTVYESQV